MKKFVLGMMLILISAGLLTACSGESQIGWKEEMLPQLPEGIDFEKQEGKTAIVKEDTVVGGLDCYPKPDVQYDPHYRWIHDLPLWENSDETLGYSGGGSLYGDWELHYFTDLPPDQKTTEVERFHTFYVKEEFVYDIWFDSLRLDSDTIITILETIEIER